VPDQRKSQRRQVGELRLFRLYQAQRRQDQTRGHLAPGSETWVEATRNLDTLNVQLRYLATAGNLPLEGLGNGIDVELESRPEDDIDFRDAVVHRYRRVVLAATTEALAARSLGRIASTAQRVQSTVGLLEDVQRALREQYPDAVLAAAAADPTTITLVADRDGLTA
jgi:hypothetical protein